MEEWKAGPKKWEQHATYWSFGKKAFKSSLSLVGSVVPSIGSQFSLPIRSKPLSKGLGNSINIDN